MDITIRQETARDFVQVSKVIEAAFKPLAISDNTEHLLVERLRKSQSFIPQLSLLATIGEQIAGYILLTRILIIDGIKQHPSLSLAPVAVHPFYQREGIGSRLILAAHTKAKSMGHHSIVLLGHPEYYPRFGYRQADSFGIKLPFDAPPSHCMAIELKEGALANVTGTVKYPEEFHV